MVYFPQLKGLVKSSQSEEHGIKDVEEAKEYLENETLRKRLIECTQALLDLKEIKIGKVLGYEGLNFKSCMTLFKTVEEEFKIDCGNIFAKALNKFYEGKEDDRTLKLLDKVDFLKIWKKSYTSYINNDEIITDLTINRFITAQEKNYQTALNEIKIKSGKKSHSWIWYIFPQLKDLVKSQQSNNYGIKDIEEAKEYLENETLRKRLIECTQALLDLKETKISKILGYEGSNFKSCMTLFKIVEEEFKINCGNIFAKALDKFFDGMLVAENVLAPQEHLQRRLAADGLDLPEALPGIFAQEAHAYVERRPAPTLKRIVPCVVNLLGYSEYVIRAHPRGPQRLVGIPQRSVGDANLA